MHEMKLELEVQNLPKVESCWLKQLQKLGCMDQVDTHDRGPE